MRFVLVTAYRAVGESFANTLATEDDPIVSVVSDVDAAVGLSLASEVDVVVVDQSVSADLSQVANLPNKLLPARAVLFDDRIEWKRAGMAVHAGFVGYLCKETSLAELREEFRRLCNGERVFTNRVADRLVLVGERVEIAPPETRPALAGLTQREVQVLTLVASGLSVRECAEALRISHSTVDNHKSRLMSKLNIHKSTELVHFAIREGLVDSRDANV